jgi:tetratricopeptide (TPR) repeat protein
MHLSQASNDDLCCNFATRRTFLLLEIIDTQLDAAIIKHRDVKQFAEEKLCNSPKEEGAFEIVELSLRPLCTSLGFHLFAKALEVVDILERERFKTEALDELQFGQHYDSLSGKLKLATFHYMTGAYSEALNIVNEGLESCVKNKVFFNSFEPSLHYLDPDVQVELCTFDLSPAVIIGKYYVFETIFLPLEMPCMPPPLRFEISGNPDIPSGLQCIVVDSLVYAHFMNFLCYYQMGENEKRDHALHQFRLCMKVKYDFISFKSTAYNLLAHCYIMVRDPKGASEMLKRSLEIDTDYGRNAASWILAVLAFHSYKGSGDFPWPWQQLAK